MISTEQAQANLLKIALDLAHILKFHQAFLDEHDEDAIDIDLEPIVTALIDASESYEMSLL